MKLIKTKKSSGLKGNIEVPGDKSISHRALIFSSLATGISKIHNFLYAQDCLSTLNCLKSLGVNIYRENEVLVVEGKGLRGLEEADDVLYAGNSGTTVRLMLGVLAGQPGKTNVITGDNSLRRRPMKRVVDPLIKMGGVFLGRKESNFLPIAIRGNYLKGIEYDLPVASAQVKSALLLAGLLAEGKTIIREPSLSRNHTELIFEYLNLPLNKRGLELETHGVENFFAKDFYVPGDFSSASFLIAGALLVPNSKLIIKNVGINPTRIGMLKILKDAGAKIEILREDEWGKEKVGNILVETSEIKGFTVEGEIVPTLIDEVPILAVIATQAKGKSYFRNVEELKVKESDRIKAILENIRRMGGKGEEIENGFVIEGPVNLKGAEINSYNDHRIAMSFIIAGLISEGETIVERDSIDISFPNFIDILKGIGGEIFEL
ncbi:MAG: 3-phosphoshikimate 1-carboxyvinyltransferase [Dictyoglomus sp. NZ13-RE01]|nr:MAG: 3-phosphoshikimate 1-carboxyvinyltransferase [Dictyoglomus sp. NZ13-RE01]